jgi:hypothetical protein
MKAPPKRRRRHAQLQPAKTTLFAGGIIVMSDESASGDFRPIKKYALRQISVHKLLIPLPVAG